jgi:hypothetical protein
MKGIREQRDKRHVPAPAGRRSRPSASRYGGTMIQRQELSLKQVKRGTQDMLGGMSGPALGLRGLSFPEFISPALSYTNQIGYYESHERH